MQDKQSRYSSQRNWDDSRSERGGFYQQSYPSNGRGYSSYNQQSYPSSGRGYSSYYQQSYPSNGRGYSSYNQQSYPSDGRGYSSYNQRPYRTNSRDYSYYNEDDTAISRKLSNILRHTAEKLELKMDLNGYVFVKDILKLKNFTHVTTDDIMRIVKENDKQRFSLKTDEETQDLKVRANQGHSLKFQSLDLGLTPIDDATKYSNVLHGTYYTNWNSIKRQGLKRMSRVHIHFAPGLPGENKVISGMRSTCEILIYIDLEKAINDGLKFFLSDNNVILSSGDKDGIIAPKYFSKVIDYRLGKPFDIEESSVRKLPVGMVDDDSSRKISATVMKYKNQNDKGKSKKSLYMAESSQRKLPVGMVEDDSCKNQNNKGKSKKSPLNKQNPKKEDSVQSEKDEREEDIVMNEDDQDSTSKKKKPKQAEKKNKAEKNSPVNKQNPKKEDSVQSEKDEREEDIVMNEDDQDSTSKKKKSKQAEKKNKAEKNSPENKQNPEEETSVQSEKDEREDDIVMKEDDQDSTSKKKKSKQAEKKHKAEKNSSENKQNPEEETSVPTEKDEREDDIVTNEDDQVPTNKKKKPKQSEKKHKAEKNSPENKQNPKEESSVQSEKDEREDDIVMKEDDQDSTSKKKKPKQSEKKNKAEKNSSENKQNPKEESSVQSEKDEREDDIVMKEDDQDSTSKKKEPKQSEKKHKAEKNSTGSVRIPAFSFASLLSVLNPIYLYTGIHNHFKKFFMRPSLMQNSGRMTFSDFISSMCCKLYKIFMGYIPKYSVHYPLQRDVILIEGTEDENLNQLKDAKVLGVHILEMESKIIYILISVPETVFVFDPEVTNKVLKMLLENDKCEKVVFDSRTISEISQQLNITPDKRSIVDLSVMYYIRKKRAFNCLNEMVGEVIGKIDIPPSNPTFEKIAEKLEKKDKSMRKTIFLVSKLLALFEQEKPFLDEGVRNKISTAYNAKLDQAKKKKLDKAKP